MRKIKSHVTGIDQGSLVLFSDFQDDGPMWTGSGSRELLRKVIFSEPFKEPPSVHVSLSMWDMDQKTNLRVDVSAQKVTINGFQILFQTWADTRIARMRADWMAIGPLKDDLDWQVD